MTIKKVETVEEFRQKLEQMRELRWYYREHEDNTRKNRYQSSLTMRRTKANNAKGEKKKRWGFTGNYDGK